MKIKQPFFNYILILLLTTNSYSQIRTEFYNELFKWKISIPNTFEKVGEDESEKLISNGKSLIENSTGEKLTNKSLNIFNFKDGKYNRFIANFQSTEIENNYSEDFKAVTEILINSLKKQSSSTEIDYTFSTEKINQIKFEKCEMKVTYPNKMILILKSYSAIIDKKILNVQIVFEDEQKGQLLLSAFRESEFKK